MEIKRLVLGYIGVNCYLVSTDKAALVIDPGYESEEAEQFLNRNSHKERLILLTHAHFDHIGGAESLSQKTGVKIAAGEFDVPDIENGELNRMMFAEIEPFCVDMPLHAEEIVKVGDLEIKVIFTPGHTKGGVCYLIDGILFSGDTLFFESIGRTDFPGGDFNLLTQSVKMLYADLPKNTSVLPGHGEETTIEHEKRCNPYIR